MGKTLVSIFVVCAAYSLGFAQTTLTLEESNQAARYCYGAGVGLSQRMVGALLAGGLADRMHPFRFDCRVEEHQGGVRVLLYLDEQPLEDTAEWLRPPAKATDKAG